MAKSKKKSKSSKKQQPKSIKGPKIGAAVTGSEPSPSSSKATFVAPSDPSTAADPSAAQLSSPGSAQFANPFTIVTPAAGSSASSKSNQDGGSPSDGQEEFVDAKPNVQLPPPPTIKEWTELPSDDNGSGNSAKT